MVTLHNAIRFKSKLTIGYLLTTFAYKWNSASVIYVRKFRFHLLIVAYCSFNSFNCKNFFWFPTPIEFFSSFDTIYTRSLTMTKHICVCVCVCEYLWIYYAEQSVGPSNRLRKCKFSKWENSFRLHYHIYHFIFT